VTSKRNGDVSVTVRRYQQTDLSALYDICVRTADGGEDARGKYLSDDLMPDLFAGPYVFLEPGFAFVLADGCQDDGRRDDGDQDDGRRDDGDRDDGDRDDGDRDDGRRAVGYVIGTPDTAAFARAYRERWIPRLADRYPVPPQPPVTPDDLMLALHYRPERLLWPGLAEYPAHLHIDLLPAFQGAGHGRRLMAAFLDAAARAGAAGVHVSVVPQNIRAIGFYRHLGFAPLDVAGSEGSDGSATVVYLGRKL
jgi:ribosomal protein S18 acetylase RimI-like enzyme